MNFIEKRTLKKAIQIYDRLLKDDQEGRRPLNRPRQWQMEERSREKRQKRHSWANRGGFIGPIIIPPTPHSELIHMMREVTEAEALPGLKFRVVEGGGKTIERAVQRSNPTASNGCQGRDCLVCKGGDGTGLSCRKSNVVYEIGCQLCPSNQQAAYVGETARNAYTRSREHNWNYEKKDSESFMFKHQRDKHHGAQPDFKASMKYKFKD